MRREDHRTYRLERLIHQAIELDQLSVREGRLIKRCFLTDLRGITLGHLRGLVGKQAKAYWGAWGEEVKDHFPETLLRYYVVNVPWWVSTRVLWLHTWSVNDDECEYVHVYGSLNNPPPQLL